VLPVEQTGFLGLSAQPAARGAANRPAGTQSGSDDCVKIGRILPALPYGQVWLTAPPGAVHACYNTPHPAPARDHRD